MDRLGGRGEGVVHFIDCPYDSLLVFLSEGESGDGFGSQHKTNKKIVFEFLEKGGRGGGGGGSTIFLHMVLYVHSQQWW